MLESFPDLTSFYRETTYNCSLALQSAAGLADFDCAAVTLFDAETREHRVVGTRGARLQRLAGRRFPANQGLVSMAVKMRHYLPARGRGARNSYVFSPEDKALYVQTKFDEIVLTSLGGMYAVNAIPFSSPLPDGAPTDLDLECQISRRVGHSARQLRTPAEDVPCRAPSS